VAAGSGEATVLVDFTDPPTPTLTIDGVQQRPLRVLGRSLPRYAVSRAGTTYVTSTYEYQVLALAPSGEPLWALRAAWPRIPIPEAAVDAVFEEIRTQRPETRREQIYSLGHQPALVGVAVDGRERLWVFPWVDDVLALQERPVDVYSPEGDLLLSAMIPVRRRVSITGEYEEALTWQDAAGDFVYRVEADPGTDEHRVVRYRLVLPGQQ
jgi:hypothetical protein